MAHSKYLVLYIALVVTVFIFLGCGGDAFKIETSTPGIADAGQEATPPEADSETDQFIADAPLADSSDAAQDVLTDSINDSLADTADEPLVDVAEDTAADSTEDTAEEPDTPVADAAEDVKPDVASDASPDVVADVIADVIPDNCTPPTITPLCQQYGAIGKILVYANVPIGPSKYLTLSGNVDFPGSTPSDFAYNCYGTLGNGEIICFPKDTTSSTQAPAIPQTKVDLQPGISSAPNSPPDTILCNNGMCGLGAFVVCSGKYEMCRVENGVLQGNAQYFPAGSEHPYIRCTIKECM